MSPHHEKAGAPRLERPGDRPAYGPHIVFELAYMSSQTALGEGNRTAGRMPSTSSA